MSKPANYAAIAFAPSVVEAQRERGTRDQNRLVETMAGPSDTLDAPAAAFIAARDTFFVASVGEDGWPYVQHRGGPPGFLRVLDERTLAFADYAGNRQYVTTGHVAADDRVALILVDFPERRRLKVYARARTVEADDDPALMDRLRTPGYAATIERAFVLDVEAYDWNCPQHIVPRWTEDEVAELTQPYLDELARLRAELTAARNGDAAAPSRGVPADFDDGGSLTLPVAVQAVRQLTPRVRALTLAAPDGDPLPTFTAGAHLRVPVRRADGTLATNAYSLTDPPPTGGAPASYEVAVLHEPDGLGGSAHVHDAVRVGDRFRVAPPRNAFALDPDARRHVLIAGGIGVTPVLAHARALARSGGPVEVHYAARSRPEAAYLDALAALLGPRLRFYADDQGDRLNVAALLAAHPDGAHVAVCGPPGLIDAVHDAARAAGWSPDRVHSERFAAAPRAADAPFVAELARSGLTLDVGADQTLLDAIEAAGVAAPSSCRTGTCRTCAVRVLAGEPDHRDHVLTDAEHAAGDLVTTCVSRALSDRLVLDL